MSAKFAFRFSDDLTNCREDLFALIDKRGKRKIGNNTHLACDAYDGNPTIYHFGYPIIAVRIGRLVLSTPRQSVTTKARFNGILPNWIKVFAVKGVWYIHDQRIPLSPAGKKVGGEPFVNGFEVPFVPSCRTHADCRACLSLDQACYVQQLGAS